MILNEWTPNRSVFLLLMGLNWEVSFSPHTSILKPCLKYLWFFKGGEKDTFHFNPIKRRNTDRSGVHSFRIIIPLPSNAGYPFQSSSLLPPHLDLSVLNPSLFLTASFSNISFALYLCSSHRVCCIRLPITVVGAWDEKNFSRNTT